MKNTSNRSTNIRRAIFVALCVGLGGAIFAQQQPNLGFTDTPMLPDGKWRVHDGTRPWPKVIDPGTASTPEAPGRPPSDAMILFDGKDASHWANDKGEPVTWPVADGAISTKQGAGYIHTKDEFGDCQLHVEWAAPTIVKGSSQGRGNSGVYLFGKYEIQVLDNYNNPTYADGTAAAVYGQYPPLVNACRKPGEWQTYDILWTAPKFKDGALETPAYVTVLHNGVAVHNHVKVLGTTDFKTFPKYTPHGPKGPIALQDHGNPVRFRNIWIRELKDYDQP
ncbi:MAG: DUF1080 domain-containing protein [Chthonomonadales bacterium]